MSLNERAVNLCLGCMRVMDTSVSVCPHCGYVRSDEPESVLGENLLPGVVLYDRYIIGKVVSGNDFGVTYMAYDRTKRRKAYIKCVIPKKLRSQYTGALRNMESIIEKIKRRVDRVFYAASTGGLITYYDAFIVTGRVYLVQQYYCGITLEKYIERYTKREGTKLIPYESAVRMILDLEESLLSLHGSETAHACINPEKVILTITGKTMLLDADFIPLTYSNNPSYFVKDSFAACECNDAAQKKDMYSDVYSLAAMLYYLLSGECIPLAADREYDDYIKTPSELGVELPEYLENAIMSALSVYHEDRIQSVPEFFSCIRGNKDFSKEKAFDVELITSIFDEEGLERDYQPTSDEDFAINYAYSHPATDTFEVNAADELPVEQPVPVAPVMRPPQPQAEGTYATIKPRSQQPQPEAPQMPPEYADRQDVQPDYEAAAMFEERNEAQRRLAEELAVENERLAKSAEALKAAEIREAEMKFALAQAEARRIETERLLKMQRDAEIEASKAAAVIKEAAEKEALERVAAARAEAEAAAAKAAAEKAELELTAQRAANERAELELAAQRIALERAEIERLAAEMKEKMQKDAENAQRPRSVYGTSSQYGSGRPANTPRYTNNSANNAVQPLVQKQADVSSAPVVAQYQPTAPEVKKSALATEAEIEAYAQQIVAQKKAAAKGKGVVGRVIFLVISLAILSFAVLVLTGKIDPENIIAKIIGQSEYVAVPDFLEEEYLHARNRAKELGLVPIVISAEQIDNYGVSFVYYQNLVPDEKVEVGTVVLFKVSLGVSTDLTVMPQVQYADVEYAYSVLHDEYGLTVKIEQEISDEVLEGHVIKQSPYAGSPIDPDNPVVTLYISKGSKQLSTNTTGYSKLLDRRAYLIFLGADNRTICAVRGVVLGQSLGIMNLPVPENSDGSVFDFWQYQSTDMAEPMVFVGTETLDSAELYYVYPVYQSAGQ